jgi:hypothetical protein
MRNLSFAVLRFLDHRGGVYFFSVVLLLLVTFVPADAQTPVVLAPVPQLQFFDQTGTPLAFGCVFTNQVASSSPLGTYTDYTGVTLNQNPVVLTAGGSANIWLQAGQAYAFVVKSAGGTNCASGSTLYTVNGIGGGSTTLTTIVPYSATPAFQDAAQNQLFEITLTGNASAQPLTFVGVTPPGYITFQITQDASGGHTFSWPANSIGGCTIGSAANQVTTEEFVYNGSNATAVGPCVTGNGPDISVGTLFDYFLDASSSVCTDANFQLVSGTACNTALGITVNGQTIEPGGSGNVNAGVATHSIAMNEGNGTAIAGLALGVNAIPVGVASANPIASTLPSCTGGGVLTFSGTLPLTCTALFNAPQRVVLGSPVGMTTNTQATILTKSVTFPAAAGTYRADMRYGVYITGGANVCLAGVVEATNTVTYALSGQNGNGNGDIALAGAEISTATYAASAVVTFNLVAVCNNGGGGLVGATVGGPIVGLTPAESTYLSVTPVLSN